MEEKDRPYHAKEGKCTPIKGLSRVVKIEDYGWTGTVYGQRVTDLVSIMQQIKKYSGLVACINSHEAFSFYKTGVFHLQNTFREQQHWRPVNHAVYLYGWGYD